MGVGKEHLMVRKRIFPKTKMKVIFLENIFKHKAGGFYVAPRVLGSSLASCLWHPSTCLLFFYSLFLSTSNKYPRKNITAIRHPPVHWWISDYNTNSVETSTGFSVIE